MKKYLIPLFILLFAGQAWAFPPMMGGVGGDMYADGTVPFTGNATAPAFVANTAANAAGERGFTGNAFSWFANSEDLVMTATANTWTFSSTTLAATMSFGSMAVTAGSFTATAAADPTITLSDSDNAAGTGKLYANSSGGANDVILYIGVESGGSESVHFIEVDGVSETVDILKPLALGANNLTMTGSLAATGARVTKGWFTDLEITNLPTIGGAAITTLLQAYDAQLDAVSTGGANNTVFGINDAGAYGYYANHNHDDSAAQFKSATASKGTRKLVQSSISDGILLTDTPVVTGNATITTPSLGAGTYTHVFAETANTLTGTNTFTGSVKGRSYVTGLMPPVVLTIASGVHDGAANAATLTDSGESFTASQFVGMTIYNITDASSCTVTANDGTTVTCTLAGGTDADWDVDDVWQVGPGVDQSGSWFYVVAASTIRHPATVGYMACYESDAAAAIIVDMAADTMIFQGTLNAAVVALDAGDSIDSSGSTTGDYMCIHNKSATEAQGKGKRGTWVDGGAS